MTLFSINGGFMDLKFNLLMVITKQIRNVIQQIVYVT